MSSIEDLFQNQGAINESIKKISINIKKDGSERKNSDYFKRRMQMLEQFWGEFQFNHDRLSLEGDSNHPYFTNDFFGITQQAYIDVKEFINQQHQRIKQQTLSFGDLTSQKSVVQDAKQEGFLTPSEKAQGKQQSEEERERNQGQTSNIGDQPPPQQQQQQDTLKVDKACNSKLDDMLRKQAANFKAFMRTAANIQVEFISEKWEFQDALQTLQARWSAIDDLHWAIESELNGEEIAVYEERYARFERQYIDLKKALNTKMWSGAYRDKTTPKLEIPPFNGSYNQWVSFRDLFIEAIHNNPSLSQAQKMQFLKSKVQGEAHKLIQHLHISSEHYQVCWDILNHRYNNIRRIANAHLDTLFGLPNIQQQSAAQIKRLHDVTWECLHAMDNIGVDRDTILVYLLSQKLDSETNSDYIESMQNSRELPLLKDFLDYLERKFTALESARRKQDNAPKFKSVTNQYQEASQSKKQSYNFNQVNNRKLAKSFHASTFTCPLCNDEHGIYNCARFLEMTNDKKLSTVKNLHLCVNCLFSHNENKCTSTKRCRNCQSPHNTLLHDAYEKNEIQQSNSSSHVSHDDTSEILLATALLKVESVDGTQHNMRALIDQGSQVSLITEQAAQKLGVKRQRCKGVVFGVGQKENNCKGMITITCSSIYNDFKFETSAIIMNNLIKNLPNKTFNKPSWTHIQNINLADPEFYSSRPVDILLGADIYSRIMLAGMIKGDDIAHPIAQQSYLGWLLCGEVKTFHCNVVLNNLDDMKQFWETEDIREESNISSEDQTCIEYYNNTTRRLENGRYEVRLPMKNDFESKLGLSKPMAIAQFKNLERKFKKQEHLAKSYKEFMIEYIDLNHMVVCTSNTTPECYLPHHGVQRADSTTNKKNTKRSLLAEISKLFDPLGWLTPISTKLKLFFQQQWETKLQWDDEVPDKIQNKWSKIQQDIKTINTFEIPRWLRCDGKQTIELHGFSDASLDAYACVVYARMHQTTTIVLVAAKSKIVPHRKVTRLELNGAHLLSKLMRKVKDSLYQHNVRVHGWTDSMVVLGWLQGDPTRWKTYVENRVRNINDVIPRTSWSYVKSSENPADAASRGQYANQLKSNQLWWQGPSWLPSFETSKHYLEKHRFHTNFEEKTKLPKQVNAAQNNMNSFNCIDQLLQKHSCINHVIRIIAWILRTLNPKRRQLPTYLTLQEINKAIQVIVKHFQYTAFEADMAYLLKQGKVSSNSKLLHLNPIIDQDGILRVGGRLRNATLSEDMKHPMIIPHESRLTELLIDQAHRMTFHGGPRLTLSHLRQKYWIIGGIRVTKMEVRKCVTCRKNSPEKQKQLMGDLPSARTNTAPKQPRSTTSNRRLSVCGVVMTLLYLLSTTKAANTTNIVELEKSLYFDKITNMQIIRDDWKIIVYYDVKPYWDGITAFDKFNEHLQNICSKIKQRTYCDIILLQLQHALAELLHYNRILLNPQGRRNMRNKRGLINGVGNIARSLFGVLDDQFAEQYQRDITLIKQNERHLVLLAKNQTSVIEAQYNFLKRSEESVERQYKLFNQHLLNLDKTANRLEQEINAQELSIEFALSAIAANSLIEHLRNIQETLLDTITNIYNGKINLHLITPEQMRDELNIISGQLSDDMALPIANVQTEYFHLYHLLQTRAKITENYFIIEIKVPLISRERYEIYSVISVPKTYDADMVTLQPVSEHLAINIKKDSYLPMTEFELQQCIQHDSSTRLCSLKKPVYEMKSDESLCVKNKQQTACEIKREVCRNMWYDLYNINRHLYFCCDQCKINVICEHQVSTQLLRKAGVITLYDNCVIKSETFTIYSHKNRITELQAQVDIVTPEIPPINNIIGLSLPSSMSHNETESSALEQRDMLKRLGTKVEQMKAAVADDTLTEPVTSHDLHQYIILYLLVGAVTLAATIYLYRRFWKRPTGQQSMETMPVPTPRRRSTTSIADNPISYVTDGGGPQLSSPLALDKSTSPIARSEMLNTFTNK